MKIRYVLGTTVPKNWIPFIAVHAEGSVSEIRLQRARMVGGDPPRGFLLREPRSTLLRRGRRSSARRSFRRAFMAKGTLDRWPHLCLGREAENGRKGRRLESVGVRSDCGFTDEESGTVRFAARRTGTSPDYRRLQSWKLRAALLQSSGRICAEVNPLETVGFGRLISIEILIRNIILQHFMRANLPRIIIPGVFNPGHYGGLERVSFLKQLDNTLRICSFDAGQALQIS
jgi:hypothetical protein